MSNPTAFAALLATRDPAELGPGPRAGVESEAALSSRVRQLCAQLNVPSNREDLVRALALLWHDHLDAAHTIAQAIENADGAFVHGIMHRREPDYSNAAYWFRRVGSHGAFPLLARVIGELLNGPSDQDLKGRLISNGQWDPFGFIDACEDAADSAGAAERTRLRQVQRLEFEVLLGWFVRGLEQ